MVAAAHDRLRELRAIGADPAHGGEQADSRGEVNREHQKAVAEWNNGNGDVSRVAFTEEILPLLADVPPSEMAEATGLTKGYCSFVR